jgi:hypothetical protein
VELPHVEAVDVPPIVQHHKAMKTLSEIEKAAEKLSSEQKRELILIQFLSARRQRESHAPLDGTTLIRPWISTYPAWIWSYVDSSTVLRVSLLSSTQ